MLVAGGTEMTGLNLVKRLVRSDFEAFIIDNLWQRKRRHKDQSGYLYFIKKDSGNNKFALNL